MCSVRWQMVYCPTVKGEWIDAAGEGCRDEDAKIVAEKHEMGGGRHLNVKEGQ